ncbi:hypothetical protein CSB20_00445 [bacterium DOLZORAL124_64_63]|nr:MAG: hypothetical protein CSB20_00445 [bacterium DOLZORAL124_64_63]
MRLLISIFLLAGLALLTPPARAGIILNTLDGGITAKPGVSGSLGSLFSAKGGNTEKINLETGGRLDWSDGKQRLRLQIMAEYEETAGIETERNIVGHLRHNRRLGERFSSVMFAQIQHDPFKRLERRWLVGAGLRREMVRTEKVLLALGATPMLEIERFKEEAKSRARGRLSIFLNFSRRLRESISLQTSAFYQPLFADLGSVRGMIDVALVVEMTGSLKLKAGYMGERDSEPASGVKKNDWKTYWGLTYGF